MQETLLSIENGCKIPERKIMADFKALFLDLGKKENDLRTYTVRHCYGPSERSTHLGNNE